MQNTRQNNTHPPAYAAYAESAAQSKHAPNIQSLNRNQSAQEIHMSQLLETSSEIYLFLSQSEQSQYLQPSTFQHTGRNGASLHPSYGASHVNHYSTNCNDSCHRPEERYYYWEVPNNSNSMDVNPNMDARQSSNSQQNSNDTRANLSAQHQQCVYYFPVVEESFKYGKKSLLKKYILHTLFWP